ncbi:hypothetical protein D3C76_1616660 [compost metagenome]
MGGDHAADSHIPSFGASARLVDAVEALAFDRQVAHAALGTQQGLRVGHLVRMGEEGGDCSRDR